MTDAQGVAPLALWQCLYPRYFYRPRLPGQLAVLHWRDRWDMRHLMREDGTMEAFAPDYTGYQALVAYLLAHRITCYTDFGHGHQREQWTAEAWREQTERLAAGLRPRATLLCRPSRGLIGLRWRGNRSRAALLAASTWGREEPDDLVWLASIRAACAALDMDVQDTAASLGTNVLLRYWQRERLPRMGRLQGECTDLMVRYSVGGRAEQYGETGMVYPRVREYDVKSAYPRAAALGVPWGTGAYIGRGDAPELRGREMVYGLWAVTVHDDLEMAPIPDRAWGLRDSALRWDLPAGEYTYGGWLPEIEALRARGASVEWLYGWSWPEPSTALAGWVDEMGAARAAQERIGRDDVAANIKQGTNAAIGRWNMEPVWSEMVPAERAQVGDTAVQLAGCVGDEACAADFELPSVFVHEEVDRRATPLQWGSYVKMVVRMALYEQVWAERARGNTVVMSNFDAVYVVEPMEVAQDSPWVWKEKDWLDFSMPYARALTAWLEDGKEGMQYVQILPGFARKMRAPPLEVLRQRAEVRRLADPLQRVPLSVIMQVLHGPESEQGP